MSAPFVGKRVAVVGTSRPELNGSSGIALDYDREKGRYNVRLDTGQVVALRPSNLEASSAPAPAPPGSSRQGPGGGGAAAPAGTATAAQAGFAGVSWSTWGLVILVAAWLLQAVGSPGGPTGGGLWSTGDDMEYADFDQGFMAGAVREPATLDQFKAALAQHSDSTGLPVVVDFFSHSCGPCRMIAPAFKRLAREVQGEAVFLKVDVNRNYEASQACNIRGMPTFQVYLHKKKIFEFSGADEGSLRRYTDRAIEAAAKDGTYVGLEVTGAALAEFYKEHDAAKVGEAESLAKKYASKTALLMRVSQQKYGKTPRTSARRSNATGAAEGDRGSAAGKQSQGTEDLKDQSMEMLQAELHRLGEEIRRRSPPAQAAEEDEEDELSYVPVDQAAKSVHRLIIVGGGPAGLAAAIYAARAGLEPLLVAPAFGGQLLGKGVDVENYPGVVGEAATGRGLVELMRRQAASFEARFVDTAVVAADFSERPFRLRVNGSDEALRAEAVVLACGAESQWLGVTGEQEFRGRGVSACATCDGFLFRGRAVLVVGGGDHAMEDALHLARTSKHVTLVHRRGSFRASKILSDRVLNHSSITVRWNSEVQSFHGGDSLASVTIRAHGKTERLSVDGAFVAIGHRPGTHFLAEQVQLDEAGYIALRPKAAGTATSVEGVFAAGDAADRAYRQAVTASGFGAMAALDAERFLNEHPR